MKGTQKDFKLNLEILSNPLRSETKKINPIPATPGPMANQVNLLHTRINNPINKKMISGMMIPNKVIGRKRLLNLILEEGDSKLNKLMITEINIEVIGVNSEDLEAKATSEDKTEDLEDNTLATEDTIVDSEDVLL